MCRMCRKDLHHTFAPTAKLLLRAAAVGVFWANAAHAKETKAPPKPAERAVAGCVAGSA